MEIEPLDLSDRASMRRFLAVAEDVNRGDPAWIPPLRLERTMTFSPRHNAYLRRAETRYWIASQAGRDVGRISAQIDPVETAHRGRTVCHFGCLAAVDDQAVFSALLAAAETFARAHGAAEMTGPFTFSINEETGLLVAGFDTPPMVMMGHDPAWCDARIKAAGYEKATDVHAYLLDLERPLGRAAEGMLTRPLPAGTRIRTIDFSDYRADIARIVDIFNDAWSGNWGFVPLTEEETEEMAGRLRPLLSRDLVQFAEVEGEAVAFMVVLPNINEAIRDLDGRLLPFGWAKALWRLKVSGLASARVPLMGVRRHVAGTLAGSALPLQLIGAVWPHARRRGIRSVELSWILEDNLAMRRILERLGADAYKTYRLYGRPLAPVTS